MIEIDQFKKENKEVISILNDIAAKQAEVVDKTSFDSFENKYDLAGFR